MLGTGNGCHRAVPVSWSSARPMYKDAQFNISGVYLFYISRILKLSISINQNFLPLLPNPLCTNPSGSWSPQPSSISTKGTVLPHRLPCAGNWHLPPYPPSASNPRNHHASWLLFLIIVGTEKRETEHENGTYFR